MASSKSRTPTLLKNSAADQSCCIFRVPHILVQANGTAYKPKIVAIGPYHHGEACLEMIQEHKQRYLEIFLSKSGVALEDLQKVVSDKEKDIRDSYSEDLKIDREKLIEMMILDGCFILMLLLIMSGSKTVEHKTSKDPIFVLRWILPILRSDLLLLENQVPLFLLRDLLETSKLVPTTCLNNLVFKFFAYSITRLNDFGDKGKDLKASHLLDLIRKTFIPEKSEETKRECSIDILPISCFNKITCLTKRSKSETEGQAHTPPAPKEPPRSFLNLVVSARKLQSRGIIFKEKKKYDTPLEITLNRGILEIPVLKFDDSFSSLLINCVAFEQFNMKCSTEITSYVTFLGCLINTQQDATFLNEKGIIENYFGTGEQISLFFKNIGKDIMFSINKSYLANVFEGVNEFTSKGYHVHWAGFKYTHFESPWAFLSSFAALVLLLLTIFQAFFAAYPYIPSLH